MLADPIALPCGVTLKNRLAKSAMSERLAGPDREPGPAHERLYRRWAEGGVGLSVTGNVMIDPNRLGEPGNVAFTEHPLEAPWRAWAAAASLSGAAAIVQLNHPGRQSPRTLDRAPVAPSAVPMRGYGAFAAPRALEEREIVEIVDRFARAAAFVRQMGFAGVQIHAAHGYLISQFLSARTNLRADRYGGPLEGRMRLLLEIVSATRAAIGPSALLSVKLNTADFQRGGFDEGDAVKVAEALQGENIDLLELSGGTYERSAMFNERSDSTAQREAFFLDAAERVRAKVKTPLMLTGGFRTKAAMDGALSSGAIDLVGLARPLAVEPDLPGRLANDPRCEGALPVTVHTGVRPLDALLTGAWYQVQIERLAAGLPADPSVSRWYALRHYLGDLMRGAGRLRA